MLLQILAIMTFTSSATAEPFVPQPLTVTTTPYEIRYSPVSDVAIPVTISGGPATVVLSIFTLNDHDEINRIQNGHLGWHYVDQLDTCLYISPPYHLEDGDHVLTWAQPSSLRGEYTYYIHAVHAEKRLRVAPDSLSGPLEVVATNPSDGLPLAEPYIQTKIARWLLGNDPSESSLIETTAFPTEEDWGEGYTDLMDPKWEQVGIPVTVGDYVYVHFNDSSEKWGSIQRFTWEPNGMAVRDTVWGEGNYDLVYDMSWTDRYIPGFITADGTYLYVMDGLQGVGNNFYYVMHIDINTGENLFSYYLFHDDWPALEIPDLSQNTAPPVGKFRNGFLHATTLDCLAQMLDPYRYMDTENAAELIRWMNMDTTFLSPSGGDVSFTAIGVDRLNFQYLADPTNAAGSYALLASDGSSVGWFSLPGDPGGEVRYLDVVSNGSAWDGIYTDNAFAADPADRGGVWYTPIATAEGRIQEADYHPFYRILVDTPKDGEVYTPGSVMEITWHVIEGPTPTTGAGIYFAPRIGTYEFIAIGESPFYWTVPAVEADSCQVWLFVSDRTMSSGFFTITTETGVGEKTEPALFALGAATPNPFNPSTAIPVDLPEAGHVRASMYNLAGQRVAVLADGNFNAGRHTLEWDASGCAAGVYVCRIEYAGKTRTVKVTLAK